MNLLRFNRDLNYTPKVQFSLKYKTARGILDVFFLTKLEIYWVINACFDTLRVIKFKRHMQKATTIKSHPFIMHLQAANI